MKTIDQFNVLIKAPFGKDYGYIDKIVKLSYLLKENDKIAFVGYEGRGLDFRDVTIIEANEDYIIIDGGRFYKNRTFILNYNKEPNYEELNLAHFKGEENRRLQFTPFPTFVKDPKLKIRTIGKKYSRDIFYNNCSLCYIRDYDPYLKNFDNIVDQQITLFD